MDERFFFPNLETFLYLLDFPPKNLTSTFNSIGWERERGSSEDFDGDQDQSPRKENLNPELGKQARRA